MVRGTPELPFRFVEDAECRVTNLLVAGTYEDESSKQYIFGRDGVARFPGALTFDYTVALDHGLTHYDYVYSKKFDAT